MAASIAQGFLELRSNLEITGLQESTISTRQQQVRSALQNGMEVVDDFLTGSYRRQTMIAPLSEADVDIFVLFPVSYFHHYNGQNGGPAGLLDFTKRTLRKRYPSTPDISRNGQAVTIRFSDFVVDVVAGFNRQGGGYLMANAVTNTWLSTDPKAHVQMISDANQWHQGKFVPLIKMLKGWNKSNNSFFRSFHIEVLALQILQNVRITDFPNGVRYFFDKARERVRGPTFDPAGYGDDIGKYINTATKMDEAVSRLTAAYNHAARAQQIESFGNPRRAFDEWRAIFSSYFPAYG